MDRWASLPSPRQQARAGVEAQQPPHPEALAEDEEAPVGAGAQAQAEGPAEGPVEAEPAAEAVPPSVEAPRRRASGPGARQPPPGTAAAPGRRGAGTGLLPWSPAPSGFDTENDAAHVPP